MTQLLDVSHPARATPNRRWDRMVKQTTQGHSYNATRILGMWVPQEMFRKGTIILTTGSGVTSAGFRLVIGGAPGVGASTGLGVTITLSGSAAANGWYAGVQQEQEGYQSVQFRTFGYFTGATSNMVTTALTNVLLQPLNWVELQTTASLNVDMARLEVIPGPEAWADWQEGGPG